MVEVKEREKKELGIRRAEHRGMMTWSEEIERLFDRMMPYYSRMFPRHNLFFRPLMLRAEGWIPDVDIFDEDGKMVVRADLPGIKREDIELAVEGDMLVIKGHRKEEKEIKEEDYYRAERAFGEFSRAIALPEGVDTDAIDASYTDGVLEVKIPTPAKATHKMTRVKVK